MPIKTLPIPEGADVSAEMLSAFVTNKQRVPF